MMLFRQNEAMADRREVFVQMVDATDRVTPKTGLTLTVQIVKAGGTAYGSSLASVVEIGAGTYRVQLTSNDLNTLGAAMLKISAPAAAVEHVPIQVMRFLDEIHLAKAALVNARTHDLATGVDQILDDDGSTVLLTLLPSEADGVIHVAVD